MKELRDKVARKIWYFRTGVVMSKDDNPNELMLWQAKQIIKLVVEDLLAIEAERSDYTLALGDGGELVEITKEQFETEYIEKSKITGEDYHKYFVTMSCNCGEEGCRGWAAIRNDPKSIKHQIDFYGGMNWKEGSNLKGILYTEVNHLAIRDLRKTHTRRLKGLDEINKEPDKWTIVGFYDDGTYNFNLLDTNIIKQVKPPYQPGEIVYIKEAWSRDASIHYITHPDFPVYRNEIIWRSPLFMPAWAARDFQKTLSCVPKRLQDMTEEDAKAEGINPEVPWGFHDGYINSFAWEWDSINPKYPFSLNPWCWDTEFAPLLNTTLGEVTK